MIPRKLYGNSQSEIDRYVEDNLRGWYGPVLNGRIQGLQMMARYDRGLGVGIGRWVSKPSAPPSGFSPGSFPRSPSLTPKVVLIKKTTSLKDGPVGLKEPVTWLVEPDQAPKLVVLAPTAKKFATTNVVIVPSVPRPGPLPIGSPIIPSPYSFGVPGRVPEAKISSPPLAKPPLKADLIFRMLNDLAGFKKWVTDLHWQWGARHGIGRGLSPDDCPLVRYVRTKYAGVRIMSDVFEVGGKRYYLPDKVKDFVAKVDSTYPRTLISTSQCLALLRE